MGIIRKTASVSTLGLVSFRSKKERLRRAEADVRKAADELASVQLARVEADHRVADAERRARQAELQALHEAKVAAKHGRKADKAKSSRRQRRRRHAEHPVRESLDGLVAAVQPVVEEGAKQARRQGREAGRRGRAAARKAAKAAERTAKKAKGRIEDRIDA